MDERTHFYSVVASALEGANEVQRTKIQAIFERQSTQRAEDILKEITGIIGSQMMLGILEGLETIMRDMQKEKLN